MSTHKFSTGFMVNCALTTEHSSSSYGIPVLVDEEGNAYGPSDILPGISGLEWMNESHGLSENPTAAEFVQTYIIAGFGGRNDSKGLIAAAKKFVGSHNSYRRA